jgi:hypothetical protein
VLAPGATPLASDNTCTGDDDYWYERTAYRKIPKSRCSGGLRLHQGQEHICPGFRAHGALFWWTLFFVPFGITALVAYWYYKRGGYRRGSVDSYDYFFARGSDYVSLRTIRLSESYGFSDSGPVATILSIPWFIVGIAGMAWNYLENLPFMPRALFRSRRGYRHVPVDEDAQVLRFEDEE